MDKIYFSSKNLSLLTEVINTQLQSELGGDSHFSVNSDDVFQTMKNVWENAVSFREGDDPREYIISLNNTVVGTVIQGTLSALTAQRPPKPLSQPPKKTRRKRVTVVSSPKFVVRPVSPPSDNSDSESSIDDFQQPEQHSGLSMDKIQEIMFDQLRQTPVPPSDSEPDSTPPVHSHSPANPSVSAVNEFLFIHSAEVKTSDAKSDYTIDLASKLASKWNGRFPSSVKVVQACLPGSDFTISKSHSSVRFFEQEGVELVASIPLGNYSGGISQILDTLQTAMNTTGSSEYSCTLNPETNKVRISSKPPSNSKVHLFHLNGEGLGELLGFKPKMYTSSLEHTSDLPFCQNLITHQTHFVRLYVNKSPVSQYALHQNTLNHFGESPAVPISFTEPSVHIEFKTDSGRYYNFQGQNHSLVLELV